ncbi:hypothetical protein BDR26DRAFT_850629 [Obelidium mucronatum]|nr:hypothetical protein BDR26DRAFT_850629 [Obelidium mucronatum]
MPHIPVHYTAAGTQNPLTRSCVEKAKEIHASIFSTNVVHKESVLNAYYTPRVEFSDPLVSVKGVHAVTQQYKFLTLFPAISTRLISVSWAHLEDTNSSDSGCRNEIVVIDSHVLFTIVPFLPLNLGSLRLRIQTILRFDQDGRVVCHEDTWSFRELIGSALGGRVGVFVDVFRRWNGYISTILIENVLGVVHGVKGKSMESPKRTFSGIGLNNHLMKGSFSPATSSSSTSRQQKPVQ